MTLPILLDSRLRLTDVTYYGGVAVGQVTSVGLVLPGPVFNISGSPVITSGNLTGTFVNQTGNSFLASPGSGASGQPNFRPIVARDLFAPYIGLSNPSAVTLVNGLNSNINLTGNGFVQYVQGPNGAFSVGGFAGMSDGQPLELFNPLNQTMTIVNNDASSTIGNRIQTNTGANIVLRSNAPSYVLFRYYAAINSGVLVVGAVN